MSRTILTAGLTLSLVCFSMTESRAGTLAHWTFNNTVSEATGQVSAGSLVGGATFSGTSAPNFGGNGSLDVTTAASHFRVESQAALNLGAASFSFAAWIQPDGAGSSSGRIFDRRGRGDVFATGTPGFQYVVNQSAGNWNINNTFLVAGPSQFVDYTTTGFSSNASGTTYSNDWHHVAMVYQAGVGASFYVDGVFDGFAPGIIGSIDSPHPLVMGTSVLLNGAPAASEQHFSGLIDEVFLFDQTLTVGEIDNLIAFNTIAFVPEPSTFVLLGCGVPFLLRFRRRRLQRRRTA